MEYNTKHISNECKCKFDERKCNLNVICIGITNVSINI